MARPKNPTLPPRHVVTFEMALAQREAMNKSAAMNGMSNGELVIARLRGREIPMVPVDPQGDRKKVQAGMGLSLTDHAILQEKASTLRMSQAAFVRMLLFGTETGEGNRAKSRLNGMISTYSQMTRGQSEALQAPMAIHPEFTSYGRLLMAIVDGADIHVPSPDPELVAERANGKFLLAKDERQRLEQLARAQKLTMAALIRLTLFGEARLPAVRCDENR